MFPQLKLSSVVFVVLTATGLHPSFVLMVKIGTRGAEIQITLVKTVGPQGLDDDSVTV